MKYGYPITVIKTERREEYMKALEKSSVEDNLKDFSNLVVDAIEKSLDTYLYIMG